MRLTLFILAFVTMSCDTQFIVDSRLKSHVDTFYQEASIRGVKLKKDNLIIRLKRGLLDETGSIGRSIIETGMLTDKQKTVLIDENYALTKDYICVETVVFHELGHTLLDRKDHEYRIPSIMGNQYICYKNGDRVKLLDELFYNL